MAFNPLALLHERECAPLYDALDSGNPSLALKKADGILSSQPDLHLASALKAIALVRVGRRKEASSVVDRLIKLEVFLKNPGTLSPLCLVLSSLDRKGDEADVLDTASKANPSSVDVGSKAFLAMVKANQWQRAQQTSLRLHKVVSAKDKKEDMYFWSSMQAYSLISNDDTLPGHQLALPLAQRMISKHLESQPFGPKSDEIMFLYATILQKQGDAQKQEALKLLNDERGRELCKRSMTLAALRYDLMEEVQDWKTIYDEALLALESGDRNWSRVQEAVKGAVKLASQDSQFSLHEIESRLSELSDKKGKRDRTLRLAPLYLIKQVRQKGDSTPQLQKVNLLELFTSYLEEFCTKACAYEDLAPYVELFSKQESETVIQLLQTYSKRPSTSAFDDLNSLYRNLNACKLARLMQQKNDTKIESEITAAQEFFALYLCALPIGKDLPKTEMQPCDDYALLSVQALIHASVLQRKAGDIDSNSTFYLAILILQSALAYCPKGYRLRVLLIRLLLQCGAVDMARKEYEEIGVKAIQQDTLGWILSSRSAMSASLLKSGSKEEESFAVAVRKLQTVWKEGKTQVPQMICKSFGSGIFSRVEEMVDFGERLNNSMTKWLVAVETARSKSLQSVGSDSKEGMSKLKMDLEQCSTSLSKKKVSDQQDYHVLLDLMPASCQTIGALTTRGAAKEPGMDFLRAMLPVAMVHLDLSLPLEVKSAEVVGGSDELTREEEALSLLALALLKEGGATVDAKVSQLFEAVLETLATSSQIVPGRLFHAASIALEAKIMIQNVILRKGEKEVEWNTSAVQSSVSSVSDALRKIEWTKSGEPSKEWCVLLDKLPSSLRNGVEAEMLFKTMAEELDSARQGAREALLDRIDTVLKE